MSMWIFRDYLFLVKKLLIYKSDYAILHKLFIKTVRCIGYLDTSLLKIERTSEIIISYFGGLL